MELDRHTIDRVARSVVDGTRKGPRPLDRLADYLADLMKGRLEAVAAPGRVRARRPPRRRPAGLDRELFGIFEKRVAKHLAVLARGNDDLTPPR